MSNNISKQEICLSYESSFARLVLLVTTISMPLWLLFPAGMILLLVSGISYGMLSSLSNVHGLGLFALIFLLIASICLGISILMAFSDNRIILNCSGIFLPLGLLPVPRSMRFKSWSDLTAITMHRENRQNDSHPYKSSACFGIVGNTATFSPLNRLEIRFVDRRIVLDLNILSEDDLRRLFMALELWTAHCKRNDALNTLLGDADPLLLCSSALTGDAHHSRKLLSSFTELWNWEANKSFRSTTFVPLVADQQLQQGRITITRQIAYGGSAAIYLGSTTNGETLVVKESVVPAYCDDETRLKAAELFEREAKLLIKLDHPRIASVFDHFVCDDRHYILLEHIPGFDLRCLVRQQGPQREAQVLIWAKQIAEVLHYLHHQDPPVMHRDLTPDNLVVERSGQLTLIDFGASNEFIGTATGTIVGKQSYIAPEQFKGRTIPKSDIYSMGCTLFFLLTGVDPRPLSASRPSGLRKCISGNIDNLVARMTDPNSGLRPDIDAVSWELDCLSNYMSIPA